MKKFLAVMLVLGMAGTAFAGGGTKANGRIEVKNLGEFPLAVIVDESEEDLLDLLDEIGSIEEFEDIGGKVLNTNERGTFRVERGTQVVGGLYLLGGFLGRDFGEPGGTVVSVGSRKVKLVATPFDIFDDGHLFNIGVDFDVVD